MEKDGTEMLFLFNPYSFIRFQAHILMRRKKEAAAETGMKGVWREPSKDHLVPMTGENPKKMQGYQLGGSPVSDAGSLH